MQKLLTISIPTWNRSALLKNLLNGITNQISLHNLGDKIELLISNNNSSDNTDEVVKAFQQQFDFITYNKNNENIGGKANVLKSMELASSKYLMFIGDDDQIQKDSLPALINFLENNPDTGILIDISNLKNNNITENSDVTLSYLLENLYWYIGNATAFTVRASFIKDNLSKYGYDYFNDSWPQTQLQILGAYSSKELKISLKKLNLTADSLHGELNFYNSYYLWRTCYFDLLEAIESIKDKVDESTVDAAKKYLKNNVVQNFYNILQCGVFIDDNETKQKTAKHISDNLHKFSDKEKIYLSVIQTALKLPSPLSKLISNIFILSARGSKGMKKKNEFVKSEMMKKEKTNKNNLALREFQFEKKKQ